MRILFSTDQIYLHGGIEKVMAVKANYFADVLGYDVHILTTEQKNNPPCYVLSDKINRIDIGVNYERHKSYFHPVNFLKIPFHFRQWKKTIKDIQPDVIISCNYAFDFYWLPFFFDGISKLKEFHSSRFYEEQQRNKTLFFGKIKYLINDFIESKFDKILVLNPDEKKYFRSSNVEIMPNPISIDPDLEARLLSKRVIAAGRIAPIKGFDTLIEVWEDVANLCPDWQLDIYGQGEKSYIDYLQDLIEKKHLEAKITIKGGSSQLQKELLNSSLYIMSSHSECYPMVLLESLSVGLPVVSFDCPTGPRNIVSNGRDGFLVEDQNKKALAEKTVFLLTNEAVRKDMGNYAKKNSSRFSSEEVMKSWVSLLKQCINKKS